MINATPVGMAGGPAAEELPVEAAVVDAAETVFEVVAMPIETPLVRRARDQRRDGDHRVPRSRPCRPPSSSSSTRGSGRRDEQLARAAAFSRAG